MTAAPAVSVVLGTYARLPFLKAALASVREELAPVPHEIIVVDGGSPDGTPSWLVRQKDVVAVVQHNRGAWRGRPVERRSWGGFMNIAFRAARAGAVCMLSDDCLVVPGAIRGGLEVLEERRAAGEKVGAAAFYWRNWPDEEAYRVGLTLGGRMFVNHGLFLKEALEAAGYADEETYRFYHADGDLGLRMWRAGYACVDAPDSYVEHCSHANASLRNSNSEAMAADWAAYLARWEGIFYDPAAKDIGGWIEKRHDDPHRTAERFRPLLLRERLAGTGRKVGRKVREAARGWLPGGRTG